MEEKYNQIISKEDKIKEELLRSIAKDKNIYFDNINNSSFSKNYEKIFNLIINDISKNISSLKITQLIEEIKKYIYINEEEPLNKIKSKILEYNKLIQSHSPEDISKKPIINQNVFLNQILIQTKDIIGCHIYYFVSKIFENCDDIFSYKDLYYPIKEYLFESIQNFDKEFQKLKKDNEIESDSSEEKKEILLKIIMEFKNRYESIFEEKQKAFQNIKNMIESSYLMEELFEFCKKYLLNFKKYENKFLITKNIFPLLYFFESYIIKKKII